MLNKAITVLENRLEDLRINPYMNVELDIESLELAIFILKRNLDHQEKLSDL